MEEESNPSTRNASPEKVLQMIEACRTGNMHIITTLVGENRLYGALQDETTGRSPLMAAAGAGNVALCRYLLEEGGAPWNAIDRKGECAGNYATDGKHWGVVNLLVDWGTRAELILGLLERTKTRGRGSDSAAVVVAHEDKDRRSQITPLCHEPSTKPDYLRQRLHCTADDKALLDADSDAVMMEWERPLMKAHAQILMEGASDGVASSRRRGRQVLNVGFGLGIVDAALQEWNPAQHIIIEAHPDVYQRMLVSGWDKKPNVRICFGKWQEVLPQLITEGVQVDAIFYDTYGEHYLDLEDFHRQMVSILIKPAGVYSFFNGLAPDNIFFHGVACQCVKLQLSQLGLDSEFLPCEIQVPDNKEWEGVRRKYWHGRDTYYLPRCTWNADFLQTGNTPALDDSILQEVQKKKKIPEEACSASDDMEIEDTKRQRLD